MRTMKDLLSVNVEKHLTLSFPLFREQRSLKFPQLAFSEKKKSFVTRPRFSWIINFIY